MKSKFLSRFRRGSSPPTTESSESKENCRILYVDDEPDARQAFRRIMKGRGLHVDVAETGQQALAMVQKMQYAVIATDLNMPGINGLELIEILHTVVPTASLVLVTGVAKLDLPTNSESARAVTCVVQKPWEIESLEAALLRGIELSHTRTSMHLVSVGEQPTPGIKVLLVEDNPADMRIVTRMLSSVYRHDYSVIHVERLCDAISKLATETFQLVLVDLSLPDARGIDGVARLQAEFPTVPVIVMSGTSDEELAVQTVQVGAQDYLVKGQVDKATLHRSIRYAIERKATEQRLMNLAQFDQLTGLVNRATFYEHARKAIARAGRQPGVRPAILMLDLDRFKSVNDTLGHDIGDMLLAGVAQRLQVAVRDSDLVARLGGDEFAVLVEDISKEGQIALPAQRIIDSLANPLSLNGYELRATTSIGISVFPENGDNVEVLIKNADLAMYRAKQNGRANYQFYDQEMHSLVLQRSELERDLIGALERGEFEVFYQPLSRCLDGKVVSFEALLQWNHPTRGRMGPVTFLSLLEELGEIIPVGDWVFRETCQQIAHWRDTYSANIRVSVNVSPKQFKDPGLVEKVTQALAKSQIPPASLALELTEDIVMHDIVATTSILEQLQRVGVNIALDNFGVGLTQLGYLVKFPIHSLKIDRSMIAAIGTPEGNTITKTLIQMGDNLGLEVVAQGVENSSQWDFLCSHGCELVQGFLISQPMNAQGCEEWLKTPGMPSNSCSGVTSGGAFA